MCAFSRVSVIGLAAVGLLLVGLAGVARAAWPDLRLRNPADQKELAPKLERIPRGHPRIFIRSDKDLEAVRTRVQADPNLTRAYGYLLDWAKSDRYYDNLWATPLQLQAAVVAYRLENKDLAIKQHCLAIMDFLCQKDGDSWTWPRMAKGLSMAYDWMYDDLTPEQRKTYGQRAIHCAQQCYSTWRHSDFNNHLYLEYGPILYVGVGLYGDGIDDDAVRQIALDGLELLFKHYLPAHTYVNRGDGGWQEGMSYDAFYTYEFAQIVELWSSATGEDLWTGFPGLQNEAAFQAYNLRPFDKHRVHVADMEAPDPVDSEVLAYMPLVGRRYRDGLARSWSDWLLTESERKAKEGDKYALDGHKFWPYVLWYDPQVPLAKPEDLPLARIFRGFGWVSMRSSWKEDASFALFICSPTWFGGHQHCDNNSFIIDKYAPLALDTGVYDTAQGHRANYFARTIAHNTVTVFDPEEKATGGDWGTNTNQPVANDGGQVFMGTPEVVTDVGPGTPFDRSDLLAYELTDQYTYAAGDATRAYAKSKVKEFTRAFLHLRPGDPVPLGLLAPAAEDQPAKGRELRTASQETPSVFVVFDRVESTKPEFKKRWLLHSVNEGEVAVSGSTFIITNGPGRLWGKALLPKEVTCESIGGPGKEFWVDGKNWPPQKAVRDDTGRWRLEVSPAKPATRDYFLHVLYACSSSTTTYPAAEVAETEAQVTATITQDGTTYVVTFSKEGALTGSVRILAADGKVLLDRPLATKVLLDKQQ